MVPIIDVFFIVLIIFAFEVFILKVNYISPSFIFTSSFLMCLFSSVVISEYWGFYYLNRETAEIIIKSIFLFVLIEEIIRLLALLFRSIPDKSNKYRYIYNREIALPNSFLYLSIIISIIGLIWSGYYIYGYIKSGDWVRMMAEYKDVVNQDVQSFGVGRTILNQLMKASTVINYTFIFIFNYNSINLALSKKKRYLYILSFITFLLFRFFLSGGRQGVFFFIVAWLTCYYILSTYNLPRAKVRKVNLKFLKILAVVLCVILPLFYYMGRMAGRKESDFVLEASMAYLSSGIYGLESIVKDNYSSSYWGEVSFPNLYPMFKFIGIMPQNAEPIPFLPFFHHGNTVSILGRWYWDFGASGTYIMVSVTSCLYAILYYFGIQNARFLKQRNILIIIYCVIVYVLYFAGYDDLFMNIISFNYFLIFVFVVGVYLLLVPQFHIKVLNE